MSKRIRLGIVGLSADPSHCTNYIHKLPLTTTPLKERYDIAAVSMSSPEKAEAAAIAHGLPKESGYHSVESLAKDSDVDLVVVSVKVPRRAELAMAAIEAGKDVYVEWPFASSLVEAEALAQRAREQQVKSMVGLPTRLAPQVLKMKEILLSGALGRILATNLLVTDDLFLKFHADKRHSHDKANGANIVTIAGGHLLDAMAFLLGEFTTLHAHTSMLFPKPVLCDTHGNLKTGQFNDSPDTFTLHGNIGDSEVPVSVCMYSHPPTTPNFFQWVITGEKASLKMEGASLMIHAIPPKLLMTSSGSDSVSWEEISLDNTIVSGAEYQAWLDNDTERIVTLDEAVVRYRMVDAIFRSAESGQCTSYRHD
ncbi:hypothetical protein BDV27DRAFT_170273 [Aspergillus caelatus]|uniref:Gfo/Idh/MocA-like oxidoreductase N-terminal domain-containing protein n=2 Tax=Aspergillus subgen. Circumdati TaxID=2720871 RepID=A0A5N7AAX4_9EURO|nr:uncharacterized protein BDV27DRAFT_170273 [Aspergillus caelatus]KAE8367004.1 hypothetical protein BDV27DRAFT_170273 [Aspergillus caelatus]KAE8416766.1 hypothetical protein BDV36DRAFT_296775 [Aspergillus pseudocaelatus]